jgi:GH25 family lysozyme M1 (1,4-beta-N-acetylmuramidase)
VETLNTWSADVSSNLSDIQGTLDYLGSEAGVRVGVYSSGPQWTQITGGAARPDVPVWLPYAQNRGQAPGFCDPAYSFTGGPVALVQYPAGGYDGDYAC